MYDRSPFSFSFPSFPFSYFLLLFFRLLFYWVSLHNVTLYFFHLVLNYMFYAYREIVFCTIPLLVLAGDLRLTVTLNTTYGSECFSERSFPSLGFLGFSWIDLIVFVFYYW